MMPSTFTSFDTILSTSTMPYIYMYGLLPSLILLQVYWLNIPSRFMSLFALLKITQSLSTPTVGARFKSFLAIIMSTFITIFTLNMWGASPYIPTLTSHLLLTFSWGGPTWFTLLVMSMMTSFKLMSAHFLPENTPTLISSFLSLVETLSSIIRPITLSFRLAANISAGHVILGMMMAAAVFTLSSSILMLITPLIIGMGYTMFELMICFIQAFVFTLLSSMYSNDYLSIPSTP